MSEGGEVGGGRGCCGLMVLLLLLLLSVSLVDEAAPRLVLAVAVLREVAAHFGLILAVSLHGHELLLPVRELALGAVLAALHRQPTLAQLRLVKRGQVEGGRRRVRRERGRGGGAGDRVVNG